MPEVPGSKPGWGNEALSFKKYKIVFIIEEGLRLMLHKPKISLQPTESICLGKMIPESLCLGVESSISVALTLI